jgi:membrane protease YdiL (CAAX protease family)
MKKFTTREMSMESIKLSGSFTQISIATVLIVFGTDLIPLHWFVESAYNREILDRAVKTFLIIFAIKHFHPRVMNRLKLNIDKKRLIAGMLFIIYFTGFDLLNVPFWNFQITEVLLAIGFALSIGLVEEIFSRGFIFANLEKYGIQFATIISSIHFGLLHLGNIFWGGQGISYTFAQVIYAAAFGYLATGLMLFTGNIWLSILLHGLTNTPMQFLSYADYSQIVSGDPNWLGIANVSITYILLGWILIQMSRIDWRERLLKVATDWKFIEPTETKYK